MIEFLKRLFCGHEYEAVNNTVSRWYASKSGIIVIQCKKCGKTKKVKCF